MSMIPQPLGLLMLVALAATPVTAAAPKPVAPPVEVPMAAAWTEANAATRGAKAAWWQAYGDASLDALIDRAIAAGPDMAQAMARIDQAQAAARAAGAGKFPSGSVNGSLARAEQSLDSGLGQLSRYVPTIQRTQDAATLNASLGWDLDLAGGIRNGARTARADLAAAQAGLAATRLALAAEVAGQYLELREAEAQARLLARQREDLAARLRYAELRLAATEGSVRDRDARVRDLAEAEAALPLQQARMRAARHALAVLTGRPAGSALPELDGAAAEPGVPLAADPAAGTPADLLRARPDLVIAEARVIAARARVRSALGEYWPHVTLGGLIGFDSNRLGSFGAPSSRVTQGFIGLRWRIFDFARIDAEVAAARGAEREALAAYRDAVLRAGAQVESAFALAAARREALAAQDRRREAAESTFASAQAARRLGEISDDQLRGESLQRATVEADQTAARRALAQAIVECRKALGG